MTLKYGRKPPHDPATHPRMLVGEALDLVAAPAIVDRVSHVGDWPMYLNDQLGDCVPAGTAHAEEVWSTYGSGRTVLVTDNNVESFYEAAGGYVPGNPSTDQGCVIQDALGVWRKTGIAGHRITAFAQLDAWNYARLKTALYLFGSVMLGVNFPASAMDQFNAGKPWDVVPNDGGIEGGHCVILQYAATGENYKVITWGAVQEVTETWLGKYLEEAWVPVSVEWLSAAGVDTDGLDVASLNAQYTALTGQPGPFPAPTPVPPTPTPGDPDAALAAVAHRWVSYHHTSIAENKRMQQALKTWLQAKNL